ncbi:sporulation integral membrane protein YtvI [Bacillus sp. 165]|uniref:sporulation integral membrane protein YtvI n=1 Tax=Bacillus sp. 165 TaxID=1529117 RepID=UPI001ADB776C|nr:sporulation integral membrane protein YtvI [Bacillus sp. 165]MBO9130613.1 sporulation integral membrane protein YtvI [Bacillus sp. 165]
MNKNYVFGTIRFAVVLVIAVTGFYLAWYVSGLIYPFIIAFLLAYIMNPIVNFLERKVRFPRALAAFFSLILMFGILAGLVTLLVTEIIAASSYLLEVLPDNFAKLITYLQEFTVNTIMPLYNDLLAKFNRLEDSQQQTIMDNIRNFGTDLTEKGQEILTDILRGLKTFLGALPNTATVLIFVLLATFFISNDWYRIGRWLKRFMPNRVQGYSHYITEDLKKALFGFVKAQFTLISMTTVIVLVGLLILHVPYAITIALITGLVDLLPYLGTGAVFVPWIIYCYFTGNTTLAIGLLILYIVVIVQRQLMEPKVLSSNIGLDPLPTLIALFVGFKLFGFFGLIIGPVSLVILKTLYNANIFSDLWRFIKGKSV